MKWLHHIYILYNKDAFENYKNSILKYYCAKGRYDFDISGPTRIEIKEGIEYFIRSSDRIGDKARSLISYNAISLAIYTIFNNLLGEWPSIFGLSFIFFACILLFPMMFVEWGNPASIASMEKAFETVARRSIKRAKILVFAGLFTGISLTILIISSMWIYFQSLQLERTHSFHYKLNNQSVFH